MGRLPPPWHVADGRARPGAGIRALTCALLVCGAVSPGRAAAPAGGPASPPLQADQPSAPVSPPTQGLTASREAQREVLARVLRQPEFQQSATTIAMERLRQRFARWFMDVWDRLGGGRLGSRKAATVFAWVVALLALAALTWWLVQSLSQASARQRLGLAPPASRRRSSRAWARAALAAHQAGDEREAARYAYRAAVARLEEEGAWRQDETRTPREYLRLLPPVHRRRDVMADLTSRFERTWYGSHGGSIDESRLMLARLKELECLSPDAI